VHRFEKFIRNEDVVFCLDVDDVLLNLTSEWNTLINKDEECIAILKEKNMYPLKEEDWKHWNFITDTLGTDLPFKFFHEDSKEKVYQDINVCDGSIKFVQTIMEVIGEHRLRLITHTTGATEELKNNLLLEYFGIKSENIIHTKDKKEHYQYNIALDDYIGNLHELKDCEDTICLLKTHHMNKDINVDFMGNINRIDSLDELTNLLLKFKKKINTQNINKTNKKTKHYQIKK